MDALAKLEHLRMAVQQLAIQNADIAQAAADDISALEAALADKISRTEAQVLISQMIAAHNASEESHPTHLAIQ